jgi:2-polyprenyl-3-methyl-5-hydroxy-6-metoxy-1,4-benzoquinol methylase
MTATQPRPQPRAAIAAQNQPLTTTPQTLPPASLDPEFLDRVALVSFQKLVLASGELIFPCRADFIDDQMVLIRDLVEALGQRPPESVLAHWRDLLQQKTTIGAADSPQARLRVTFHPADVLLGLVGGFQVGIKVLVNDAMAGANSGDEGDGVSRPVFDHHTPSLLAQTLAQGTLRMAALPSLIDQHLKQIRRLLEALGQKITEDEVAGWRGAIAPLLHRLFQQSPNAYLVVRYRVLDPAHGLTSGIALELSGEVTSIEAEYQSWTHTRQGPLFGAHADAKVLDVAAQVGDPAHAPVLDIGAGTGRNSLALAQQGFVVDALELAPALVEQLTQAKDAANLSLNVIEGNILDPQLLLPHQQYKLIFLSEVVASHFRSVDEVRQLFVRLSALLQPGGILLFNTFMAVEGYLPTPAVRELAEAFWSCVFTDSEIHRAMADQSLQLISNESAANYEKTHLPEAAWPPTDWYVSWATGRNLFSTIEQPPVELRWMLWQRLSK